MIKDPIQYNPIDFSMDELFNKLTEAIHVINDLEIKVEELQGEINSLAATNKLLQKKALDSDEKFGKIETVVTNVTQLLKDEINANATDFGNLRKTLIDLEKKEQ